MLTVPHLLVHILAGCELGFLSGVSAAMLVEEQRVNLVHANCYEHQLFITSHPSDNVARTMPQSWTFMAFFQAICWVAAWLGNGSILHDIGNAFVQAMWQLQDQSKFPLGLKHCHQIVKASVPVT